MKRLITASAGLAGVLAATLLPMAGSASAATSSVLTVTPVGARQAQVCWTDYEPDSGTVTDYRITATPGDRTPPVSQPAPGQWCADFVDLRAPETYTFAVEAQLDGAAWVAAGSKTEKGFALTARSKPKVVIAGRVAVLRGTLLQGWDGKAVSGAPITIERKRVDSNTWERLAATVTTDADGRWSKKVKPPVNYKYRALYLEDGVGGWSTMVDIGVRATITLDFSRNPVRQGSPLFFRGHVTAGDLALMAGQPISLQRKEAGGWRILRSVPVQDDGSYGVRLTASGPTDYKYRWEFRGGREYETSHSKAKVLTVT